MKLFIQFTHRTSTFAAVRRRSEDRYHVAYKKIFIHVDEITYYNVT